MIQLEPPESGGATATSLAVQGVDVGDVLGGDGRAPDLLRRGELSANLGEIPGEDTEAADRLGLTDSSVRRVYRGLHLSHQLGVGAPPVSYTHLTLPTKRI